MLSLLRLRRAGVEAAVVQRVKERQVEDALLRKRVEIP